MVSATPFSATSLCCDGLRSIVPYVPGRTLADGIDDKDIIQLASNENLLGPSPLVAQALAGSLAGLHMYPDGSATMCKEALAKARGAAPENITVCNGSNEAIELVARCFLESGDNAVFARHSFAVYELVTLACGAKALVSAVNPSDSRMPFGCDVAALLRLVNERTKVIFLANPNNPTGTWLTAAELRGLLDKAGNAVVLVDQAYYEYVAEADYPDAAQWLEDYPQLVVTGTFSKIYALAGLRIGYAIASREISDLMNRVRQPFNVNALAQTAARAALLDEEHLRRSVEMTANGREYLRLAFREMGLKTLPSVANFLCFEVGERACSVADELLCQGIAVRRLKNYGLRSYLRVTVGLPEHNEKFVDCLANIMRKDM